MFLVLVGETTSIRAMDNGGIWLIGLPTGFPEGKRICSGG